MVSSRIEETWESWIEKENSSLKKRIGISKEAITAHLERKYYLSISTLMPQVEGLLKDAVKKANIKVNLSPRWDAGNKTDILEEDGRVAEIMSEIKAILEQWQC